MLQWSMLQFQAERWLLERETEREREMAVEVFGFLLSERDRGIDRFFFFFF